MNTMLANPVGRCAEVCSQAGSAVRSKFDQAAEKVEQSVERIQQSVETAKFLAEKRKGQTSGGFAGGLIGVLIFSVIAGELGPQIISNFTGANISGTEGVLFGLGGLIAAAGIVAVVADMMGFDVF